MATVFYNRIPGTKQLATVVSDSSPQELIEKGVIPIGAAYLVLPDMNDDMPEEERLKYKEIAHVYFDDYKDPTEIVVDYPSIMLSLIDEMRVHRNTLLNTLDYLQQRAIGIGNQKLTREIEADKQKLRDSLDIDVTKYKRAEDFKDYIPDIFFIDYKVKFEKKIKACV